MHLEDVIAKIRCEETWKSYVVSSDQKVLGGCVLKEHQTVDGQAGFAELFLLAVRSNNQTSGLGRRILAELKKKYERIVTFADMRATGFFDKMGFKCVPERGPKRERLLSVIHQCSSSQLMIYERGDD